VALLITSIYFVFVLILSLNSHVSRYLYLK
jgi:hypothetical protein